RLSVMKTILLVTLIFALFGALLTPLVATKLLPVCYSGEAASKSPGSMMPLFILFLPGLLVAGILGILGMELGLAMFVIGGFVGFGLVGMIAGAIVVAVRRRPKPRR